MKRLAILATLVVLGLSGSDAALADERMVAAKKDFDVHCAPCHGTDGKGRGPFPPGLAKKPADLTEITAKYGGVFPEDRVFETIAGLDLPEGHGSRDMPIWGDVFITESVGKSTKLEGAMKASDDTSRRIVALIRYIETLQAAP